MTDTLTSKTVQKYMQKSIPAMIKTATKYFNAFIRRRDANQPCIACGQFKELQAGHYYPAGHYPMLRFNEDNVWGECLADNYYSGDHLISYRENLIGRIGLKRVEQLDLIAKVNKRTGHKWDRYSLIEIIEKYKKK